MKYETAIARRLLKHSPSPDFRRQASRPDFGGWSLSEGDRALLESNANAFFFGAIFDRQITAQAAWQKPLQLKQRLGHLNVRRIAEMEPDQLADVIREKPALHRLVKPMAKAIVSASVKLVSDYKSDAANIWNGDPGAQEVLNRLLDFEGIGQKIAHMTVRLLVSNYGVVLSGWQDVDIAVDRHVARVFLRTGLVGPNTRNRSFKITDLRDDIIAKAREMSADFPAALDEAAFLIGRDWCSPQMAHCNSDGGDCPLETICLKKRRSWQVE